MADEEDGVVIVDASGTEHHFPAGFDPKKAGGIVRYRTQAHPPSTEDFAPAQPDISIGNVLWNTAKSLNPLPALAAMAKDARPEDAALGPAAVLAPLLRSAQSGMVSEGEKAVADAKRGRGWEAGGHAVAAAIPLIGPAAAGAGEDIGSGDTARMERGLGTGIGLVGGIVAPRAVGAVSPRVAPALATIGEQLASKGGAVTRGVARADSNPYVRDIASEAIGHAVGAPFGASALARRVLGHVLDSTRKAAPEAVELPPIPENAGMFPLKPVNAGGSLLRDASGKPIKVPSSEQSIADALSEARRAAERPVLPDSVELPPPASLPPGYTPRSTVPPVAEPAAAPAPQGRLVPVKAPPVEAQIADALAEARQPTPPALVTTPPPAELPPGYTPRSTVPKVVRERMAARQAKMAGPAAPATAPAAPPKRAYFLRSPEDIAAASAPAEAVQPTGSITIDDLPEAWKSRTGQDLFPTTGAEAKEITAALRAEIKDRGMTIGQAIAAVSKNRSISTATRYQIQRALAGGK